MAVLTNHVVAVIYPEHQDRSWPARVVCACGWTSSPMKADLITAAFHLHVRAAEQSGGQ